MHPQLPQRPAPGNVPRLPVATAIGDGWRMVRANPGGWWAPSAAGLAAYALVFVLVRVADNSSSAQIIPILFAWALAWWWVTGVMVRGALLTLDGIKPQASDFFRHGNAVAVLIAGPLYGAAVFVGLALAILPGVFVVVLGLFLLPAIVDQRTDPFTAAGISVRLVWRDLGGCLLLVVLLAVLVLVWPLLTLAAIIAAGGAGLVTALGLLVAWPVAVIAVTSAYRRLTHA